ncbi:Histidine kinase CKI1 [Acorus calamus]|uniref:histidine kinase n=1 Tax=Acorus calamus TaxID=4465 RepID=A0AAV9CTN3_ACOCL|nr:Histidine kinase CKI1 [Acorus calamus]
MALRASLVKQKEATQQAERKAVNKSMAFANASHDVRTSLAAISGLIELCRKDIGLQAELEESLKQMESCATDLMDASKLEAGKTTLNEDEFNIAQVLEEVVDMFHVVGFQKGLEVILDPCDGSILKWSLVKGDCRRLKQIMWNLLNNAVKFTSKGHILVRVRAKKPTLENHILSNASHNFRLFDQRSWMSKMFSKGDGETGSARAVKSDPDLVEFVIEVDDTGSGIPKEKKKSVFENFVQLKKSGYDGPEGTGLGLGLVQSYVRLMGGDISIIDKEPGKEDRHKAYKSKGAVRYMVILVDMSCGPFAEMCSILANFTKGLPSSRYRIVWLAAQNTPSADLKSLRDRQAPCDLVLKAPFHGSRLDAVLRLLREFGSTVERRIETEPVTKPSSSKPAPPKPDLKDAKPLSGMTMLVAEDHMVMQKLTRAKLSILGVDTVFCENGEETLKSVQEALRMMPEADQDGTSKRFPYDAILMDCQMPVMDGFEAARLIRLEEKGYGMHIPIIALTGHASNEESTKIYQAGMDHHLVKPLQPLSPEKSPFLLGGQFPWAATIT